MKRRTFDITEYPDLIETLNAIVNDDGVAEIKAEFKDEKQRFVVVEQRRKVRASTKLD